MNKSLYLVKYRIRPNVNVLRVYVLASSKNEAKRYLKMWVSNDNVLILDTLPIDKLLSVPKAYREDIIINLNKSIKEYFESQKNVSKQSTGLVDKKGEQS